MGHASLGDRWREEELSANDTDYRMIKESTILRWWHIPAGRNVTVTIERVTKVTDKKTKAKQYAIRFRGANLPYLTNRTAEKTLGAMHGRAPKDWVGKRCTLYRTTTVLPETGEEVPCIRIRPKPPGAKQADVLPDEKASTPEGEQLPENDGGPRLTDAELDELRRRAEQAKPNAEDVSNSRGDDGTDADEQEWSK